MGKGIRKPGRPHKLEGVSLGELIHQHVRVAIETAVREELLATLGATPYERSEARRGYRKWHQGTDADGTERAGRAHAAARHPVPVGPPDGMDLDDPPALSAADAGGE